MEKKKIGHRTEEYNLLKAKQDELDKLCGALEAKAKEILGVDKIEDYVSFMAMPYGYLVSEFWNLYGKNEPPHTDKERFLLSKMKVNQLEIDTLSKNITALVKSMRQHAPAFTKTGMELNLKEESFNMYLDPDKKDEYEALEMLFEAAKELKRISSPYVCNSANIVQYHPGLRSTVGHGHDDGVGFKIDPYKYSK